MSPAADTLDGVIRCHYDGPVSRDRIFRLLGSPGEHYPALERHAYQRRIWPLRSGKGAAAAWLAAR